MSRNSASLVALCASVFVVGTSEYLVAGMLPEVGADLHVPQSTAGQAVTAYALGVVIGGPAVTMLTARLPRKPLALGLMLLFAAGSALSALAPSFTMLLAGEKKYEGEVVGRSATLFTAAFNQSTATGTHAAMESFEGTLHGRTGSFNLAHAATTLGALIVRSTSFLRL